jgi:hypothetical protein
MLRPTAAIGILAAVACVGDAAREADRPYTAGLAHIESVEVRITEGAPPWVDAVVRGVLPDACTALEPADVRRLTDGFDVTLATRRPFGARCAQGLVPFQKSITLPVEGRLPGAYVVTINGVSQSFVVHGTHPTLLQPGEFD